MGEVSAIGITGHGGLVPGIPWAPPRARRCLFGPPDPQGTKALLQVQTKALEEESMERWNFDFANERPLAGGRYAWTPVVAVSEKDAPDSGGSNAEDEGKEQRQTLITDFMRKRKLSSSSQLTSPTPKCKRRFST